jgi:hypothetical protein
MHDFHFKLLRKILIFLSHRYSHSKRPSQSVALAALRELKNT